MLRIQRRALGKVVVFALSGRMGAEHVVELRSMLESESGGGALVLDLEELQLVDRDAVTFLVVCESNGTTLENCPAYVREWMTRQGDDR